ncbi:MAG TPA: ferredoxin [Mycobacteriales bacterium]|nr:ferredoxin [Mycobacteriales bacterium]
MNHDLCAGVAMCTQHAPGLFHLDENGQSIFDVGGTGDSEQILEAIDACPMTAIREVDDADEAR